MSKKHVLDEFEKQAQALTGYRIRGEEKYLLLPSGEEVHTHATDAEMKFWEGWRASSRGATKEKS